MLGSFIRVLGKVFEGFFKRYSEENPLSFQNGGTDFSLVNFEINLNVPPIR